VGIVVPLWIWVPVVMWILWRYERGKRMRLEDKYHLGMQVSPTLVERGLLPGSDVGGPQSLLEERHDEIRERRMVGRARELGEMRNILIVAVLGLLSAILYAREPGPPVVVAEGGATASPLATQIWPTQANPPAPWRGPSPEATATNLPQSNVPVPPIPPNQHELGGPANVNSRLSPPPR